MMATINRLLGDSALPDARFDEAFELWWPKLKEKLDAVRPLSAPAPRRTDNLVREILEIVRRLDVRLPPVSKPFAGTQTSAELIDEMLREPHRATAAAPRL